MYPKDGKKGIENEKFPFDRNLSGCDVSGCLRGNFVTGSGLNEKSILQQEEKSCRPKKIVRQNR